MGCFSGRLMSAASDQKLFCKLCSPFCCSFDGFVEEKVISPSFSSAILTPPPDIHSFQLLFDHFQFALIHGPYIPGSCAILFFTASGLASITSPIHNWVSFLLWLHPFFPSGVISPLISSSILGTYQPGEFLFQDPIILPSHTVHGVLEQEY